MTDIQAAIGIHQLKKIDKWAKTRERIWAYYVQNFKDLPVILPANQEPETVHARHLFTILIDKTLSRMTRDEFIYKLFSHKIGTGVHFIPVHLHQYYRHAFGYRRGNFPNSEFIGLRTVSIPLSAKLSDLEVERIVTTVKKILRK